VYASSTIGTSGGPSCTFGAGAGSLEVARSAEPSCRACRAGGEGQGHSLWPGGDLGRRSCGGHEHGTPEAARAQRRRAGGLTEVAVPSGAARRSEDLPSLSGAGGTPIPPRSRTSRVIGSSDGPAPGDSRRGPARRRLRPPEGSPRARPKLTSAPGRYVKPTGRAAGAAEGQVGESADSRTAQTARGVTAGAGAALAGAAGPCLEGAQRPKGRTPSTPLGAGGPDG